jgi:formylglycine-generating enzyme required for sulfatase activity
MVALAGQVMQCRWVMPAILMIFAGSCISGKPKPAPSEMIAVRGGSFVMGDSQQAAKCVDGVAAYCSPAALATMVVQVSNFRIDATEVTNAQYRFCVDKGICKEPLYTGPPQLPAYFFESQYDDYPVVYVTWKMAEAYCDHLGYDLPTEAQWEYAARADEQLSRGSAVQETPRLFPWGNQLAEDCERAHFAGCSADVILPVAVGKAEGDRSTFGVADLAGNVAEWVQDSFNHYAYCAGEVSPTKNCGDNTQCIDNACAATGCKALHCDDPSAALCINRAAGEVVKDPANYFEDGPATAKTYRGGSYISPRCGLSSAFRYSLAKDQGDAALGFRCAAPAQ